MTDFLDEKRNEIKGRITELRPLVEEHNRLEAALAALADVPNGVTASARAKPTSAKAAVRRRSPKTRRPGRPKGSGPRGTKALELVKASPGITIPQLADKMGIKQNYLYRVMPGLAEAGLVRKDGRGWHPKGSG
jgi:hypothetical protein